MNSIIIDLEMNEVIKELHPAQRKVLKFETMEIGAVKLNSDLEEIDEFKAYIKPVYNPIGERYTKLTGISDDMVKDADIFENVIINFVNWCGQDYKIYSWSNVDRVQIKKESRLKEVSSPMLDYMVDNWIDFQAQFSKILGIHKNVGLKDAVNYAGFDFEGEMHDALWDARNTAVLFRMSKNPDNLKEVMKPFVESMKKTKAMTFSLGELMQDVVIKEE